jgi:acetyl-CoA carboxylase biotin carboxyl carrier protein
LDHKELRELIEIISRSNFSTFELERKDFKLKLVKENGAPVVAAVPRQAAPAALPVVAPPDPGVASTAAEGAAADDGLTEVPSPIVGTYYEAPSPGADPFVSVGDRVRKGQVLCIVEAMKLMNEIEAEIDAEVVEILASNGQPVEFGEVLFKIRPRSG